VDVALWGRRAGELRRRAEPSRAGETVVLGPVDALRARLPLLVRFAGREYRIVEEGGELLAHATVCPHLLGPLGESAVDAGKVRCPWHGYSFDLRSGRCPEDPRLRLRPPPRLVVGALGHASLVPARAEASPGW